MEKILITLIIAAIALSGNVLARDDYGHGHDKHHDDHHMRGGQFPGHLERMVKRLDLDKDKSEKAREIFNVTRTEMKTIRDQIREKRKSMYEQLHADDANEASVLALAEELGKLKTKEMVLYIRTHMQISTILTPEQRKKLREMHKRHHRHDS